MLMLSSVMLVAAFLTAVCFLQWSILSFGCHDKSQNRVWVPPVITDHFLNHHDIQSRHWISPSTSFRFLFYLCQSFKQHLFLNSLRWCFQGHINICVLIFSCRRAELKQHPETNRKWNTDIVKREQSEGCCLAADFYAPVVWTVLESSTETLIVSIFVRCFCLLNCSEPAADQDWTERFPSNSTSVLMRLDIGADGRCTLLISTAGVWRTARMMEDKCYSESK